MWNSLHRSEETTSLWRWSFFRNVAVRHTLCLRNKILVEKKMWKMWFYNAVALKRVNEFQNCSFTVTNLPRQTVANSVFWKLYDFLHFLYYHLMFLCLFSFKNLRSILIQNTFFTFAVNEISWKRNHCSSRCFRSMVVSFLPIVVFLCRFLKPR